MTRSQTRKRAGDPWCRWTGLPAARLGLMIAASMSTGAVIEMFMINVWIKDTNCAHKLSYAYALPVHDPGCPVAVYEVVKKKEAEKRSEAEKQRALKPVAAATKLTPEIAGEMSFGEALKLQWEEKKRELAKQEQEKAR